MRLLLSVRRSREKNLLQPHGKDAGQSVITKLKCAAGLAELATKKYKSAAKYFLQASFDHCDFPEVSGGEMADIVTLLNDTWGLEMGLYLNKPAFSLKFCVFRCFHQTTSPDTVLCVRWHHSTDKSCKRTSYLAGGCLFGCGTEVSQNFFDKFLKIEQIS